jgi:hypothetical protein
VHCLDDSHVQSVSRWLRCKNCEAAYEYWHAVSRTWRLKAVTGSSMQSLELVVLFVVHERSCMRDDVCVERNRWWWYPLLGVMVYRTQ